MKEGTRGIRGNEGTFGDINDYDEIPSNFQKDFIRNSLKKDAYYQYLAERFIDLHSSTTQILVVSYKDAILKTKDVPDEDKYDEADARAIRHLMDVSKCQMFDTIVVYSSDKVVLLLCLAYHHYCKFEGPTCTVFCEIGLGPNLKIYNVSVNA